MDSSRLEAFSDGVFGVAITLLVFNLAVPGPGRHEDLAAQLAGHWPAFAAYVVSFATIGIIWVNHHTLFRNFSEVDRTLLFLNLLLLFFVVSIPFATSTIAAYLRQGGPDASLAAAIYEGVFVGMSMSFAGLFWWAIRHEQMKIDFSPDAARRALIRFGIGNVGYLAAVGVAFLSATAALIISGLIAVYYIFEQTPATDTPNAGQKGRDSPGNIG
jgi:uncharacterized membrane protein